MEQLEAGAPRDSRGGSGQGGRRARGRPEATADEPGRRASRSSGGPRVRSSARTLDRLRVRTTLTSSRCEERHPAPGASSSDPRCASLFSMVLSDRDIDLHVERVQRNRYKRRSENAIEAALIDEIERDLARIEREEKVIPTGEHLRGIGRPSASTTCSRKSSVFKKFLLHHVFPIVDRARSRLPLSRRCRQSRSQPGEDTQMPARPTTSSSPCPKTSRHDHLQHHVGDHGLHRPERRDPVVPGSQSAIARRTSARRSTPYPRSAARRCSSSTAASGTAARGAERCPAHGRRHDLLLGLDSPAGEPAARRPARRGSPFARAPPEGLRLRPVPWAHRSHRQVQPRGSSRRCGPRPVVGLVGGAGVEELEGD